MCNVERGQQLALQRRPLVGTGWCCAHQGIRAEGDVHDAAGHVEQAGRQAGSIARRPARVLQQRDAEQRDFVGRARHCDARAVRGESRCCHCVPVLHVGSRGSRSCFPTHWLSLARSRAEHGTRHLRAMTVAEEIWVCACVFRAALKAELSQYKAQGGCLVPNQGSEECSVVSHLKDRQAAMMLAGRQIEHFQTLMQHKRSPGSVRRHYHI